MVPPLHIARILVPVDGSEYSRHAAEHAVGFARAHGAEVIFLYVLDVQTAEELAQQGPGGDEEQVRERLLDQGRTCLRDMSRLAAAHGVSCRDLLAEGDPSSLICETAARERADVIVVGKLGRRGARRILMGSITRRVIECADRPVLVVTAPLRQPRAGR
jgi:nucleotide-binding universal stress UspA family protein